MSPATKQLDIDARWLFWRMFLLFFFIFEMIVWQRLQRFAMRAPGHPMLVVFLFAPRATPRSIMRAIFAGGAFTFLAMLIVRLIVRPLLNLWLRPAVDASGGLFHLTASELIVASEPARRRTGWLWKPGSLTLTNRRLWFFPGEYSEEPWFLPLDDIADIVPERPLIAELAPIRNWPKHVRVSGRSGSDAVFALADPQIVLAWHNLLVRRDGAALVTTGAGHLPGGFDE